VTQEYPIIPHYEICFTQCNARRAAQSTTSPRHALPSFVVAPAEVAPSWSQLHLDFDNLELSVTRSIWHQVVGDCKTEASARPIPLDSYMADDLRRWRRQSVYQFDDDYVFASESMRGKHPYWPDNLMKRHIWPVANAIGIHKRIGWHTFRHTFSTLLKVNGEDVKTVQKLLRHASSRITLSRITLDIYTQATTSNKRAAQSKVIRMIVPNLGKRRMKYTHKRQGRMLTAPISNPEPLSFWGHPSP